MRLAFVCYKKLTRIGIYARIRQAHHSAFIVCIVSVEFIPKFASPNRFASLSRTCGIAALDTKAFDIPMKGGPIVIAAGAQGEEIKRGSLRRVAKHLDFYITEAGVESD